MFHRKGAEKTKTQIFTFNNFYFENRAAYEIMLNNTVEPGRPQITTRRMRITCWIPKATVAHSEYVITRLSVTSYVHIISS